jgi:hypothetical protein
MRLRGTARRIASSMHPPVRIRGYVLLPYMHPFFVFLGLLLCLIPRRGGGFEISTKCLILSSVSAEEGFLPGKGARQTRQLYRIL